MNAMFENVRFLINLIFNWQLLLYMFLIYIASIVISFSTPRHASRISHSICAVVQHSTRCCPTGESFVWCSEILLMLRISAGLANIDGTAPITCNFIKHDFRVGKHVLSFLAKMIWISHNFFSLLAKFWVMFPLYWTKNIGLSSHFCYDTCSSTGVGGTNGKG